MKVAIIGAGISGLYLAQKLSHKNVLVDVFEKRDSVGKVCCSGLFSKRIFDYFPESKKLVENEISECLINFPKKTLKICFKQPFFVMDHSALDRLAAEHAEKAKAKIFYNQKISNENLTSFCDKYDRVIGCDGALSAVRKYLFNGPEKFMLGMQGFVDEQNKTNGVETWPTKRGFIWKIPRGRSTEYGIMEKPSTAKKIFDDFLNKRGISPLRLCSAIIPQNFFLPLNEKVTFCGDASGLTKPWSGGGVIWQLKQADFLLKNFPNLLQYKKEAERFFVPQIMFAAVAKKIVYTMGFKFPFFIPTNYQIDGDFMIWK